MTTFKLTPLLGAMISAGALQHAMAQQAADAPPATPTEAAAAVPANGTGNPPQKPADPQSLQAVIVVGQSLGKGEARANSVVDKAVIQAQPAGLDPLKVLGRVPGLQVSSSDSVTGSFSMRLTMRGLNKEQIGISVDGIPNGSSLSNGGTMPNRLLDSANLDRVDVSQSAGDIGTPSNQALGGYIDFRTRNPARKQGGDAEISLGNHGYQREFARYDTGELAPGLTAYVDASHGYVRTWPGEQSGRSRRDHADLRVLKEFENGSSLRGTISLNSMADNDYDALALRAGSKFKAVFEVNPDTDALTDRWTGNPSIDQNNRSTRGIDSKETFAHLDALVKLGESTAVSVKPYYHHQEGAGWFYVPYKQLPANGQTYSTVAAGTNPATGTVYTPVATVQECFANQYAHDASGALIPTAAVVYPTGVSAASLAAAGCPAAAKYQMNPQSAWGSREASRRRGGYETNRTGTLGELTANFAGNHDVRAGGWYEYIRRTKTRNWYTVTDPTQGFDYLDSALYSVTQDRLYRSHTWMAYVQDKISLLDDRAQVDVGATYQRFREIYTSAVEFAGSRSLAVSSKLLPKVGALYRVNDDTEVFASASRNFSAIPDSVFEGTSAIDAKTGIKPETSVNKDLGVRYLTKGLGLSFQVYSIDYRDRISIQNGKPDADIYSRDATTTFRNQGGIRSRGFETTLRAAWNKQFEVYANYAYADARYIEDTPGEGIKMGDPVLGVSRHNAFAELIWTPVQSWRLAGNVKYVGKAAGTYGDVPNTLVSGAPPLPREYMPEYALVGLAATYKLGGVFLGTFEKTEIGVNVENLLDKRYLGGIGAELTSSNPLTSGRYFLGSPRALYLTLRAHF